MNKELTYQIECGPDDVLYTFVYEVEPYDPGRTWGDPEKCYPPEGGFASVVEVRHADGSTLPCDSYESAGIDIKRIEEQIYEAWCENQGPDDDPPDPRDDGPDVGDLVP